MNEPVNQCAPQPEWSALADMMGTTHLPRQLCVELARWATERRSHLPPPLGWQEVSALRERIAELEVDIAKWRESEAKAWSEYHAMKKWKDELEKAKGPTLVVLPNDEGLFTKHQVVELVRRLNEGAKPARIDL